MWLWCRQAAVAPIQPLGWELLYATDVALKKQKTKTKDVGAEGMTKCYRPTWLRDYHKEVQMHDTFLLLGSNVIY